MLQSKLEYGFDELENLEKSNNKKTRGVTNHGEGDEGSSESRLMKVKEISVNG
jgi:hypothetical protein